MQAAPGGHAAFGIRVDLYCPDNHEGTHDAEFLFIGLQPNTKWLPDTVERDKGGFLATNGSMQTNLPGVFAAGDARSGSTKQAASSAGEGAPAALMIRDFLNQRPDLRKNQAWES